MDVIKEIEVTDDYLSLDQSVIRCQNKDSIEDCKTRNYIHALQKECGCLPFSIRGEEQVHSLVLGQLQNPPRILVPKKGHFRDNNKMLRN